MEAKGIFEQPPVLPTDVIHERLPTIHFGDFNSAALYIMQHGHHASLV